MLCSFCRLFNASAERVMWRLRSRLFEHIIHQEVGFFDRVRTGELMNRLSEVTRLQSCCCKSHAELHMRSLSWHCCHAAISRSPALPSCFSTCQLIICPADASDFISRGRHRLHRALPTCVSNFDAFRSVFEPNISPLCRTPG